MEIKWTEKSLSDLSRLYAFLASVNKQAAATTIQSLTAAPKKVIHQPRLGEKLEEYEPREVRRLLVGHYEMRYEIEGNYFYVLRIWHTREHR
ncbi:type II toxin-antitoxin system RelE/ParE family toxin [Paraglaciecola sp. MB-3u-78]|jgi:plasmid stabilization system protein ParE|uniref:type II toxin-antitoxin system RelE/ParE family toxin n=1 Tax=Paraglaciecola sp. MB-3u-78 TaxID=2058332 RepID=UPI000C323488|nr:type II toxin-antitoxin system RelE/ParE family toxin [Paraglaciecola sp. MB-3u-78]PKG95963.1 plasmid stabilization protein [Paraglaciecola sp. MB-3u-78]